MMVVLPAPLCPSNPTISPLPIEKLTESTANVSPKRRVRLSASITSEGSPAIDVCLPRKVGARL